MFIFSITDINLMYIYTEINKNINKNINTNHITYYFTFIASSKKVFHSDGL